MLVDVRLSDRRQRMYTDFSHSRRCWPSLIVLNMASTLHSYTIGSMRGMLEDILKDIGKDDHFYFNSNIFIPCNGREIGGNRQKAPDLALTLSNEQYYHGFGLNIWPQVVIEIGTTESQARLQRDAQFWLLESEGAVRWVLTLKCSQRRALLCSWIVVDGKVKAKGAMEATIQQDGHYTVTNENVYLWASFETIFLREPKGDEPEKVIIKAREFVDMLNRVQDRMQRNQRALEQRVIQLPPMNGGLGEEE